MNLLMDIGAFTAVALVAIMGLLTALNMIHQSNKCSEQTFSGYEFDLRWRNAKDHSGRYDGESVNLPSSYLMTLLLGRFAINAKEATKYAHTAMKDGVAYATLQMPQDVGNFYVVEIRCRKPRECKEVSASCMTRY